MMGWVIMLLLAGLVVAGLWVWVRKDVGAVQFLAAALLLALAGYAWQGRPDLWGAPKAAVAPGSRPKSDFAQLRRPLIGETDMPNGWLTAADSYIESGDTQKGVKIIQDALVQYPREMDLWLGLADALIQHADGQMTPAAELAFNRAAQVAPNHPAPAFFYALAMARMGQFDPADQYLRQVLANPQVTDLWRDYVARAQRWLVELRASGATLRAER